ncbi:MAG: hypothetical protein ABI091_02165 [Ferruginibacter sp.]
MKFSFTIRRIISAFLLVVFALSITPVIVLHNLTANHTDISYADKNKKCNQVSRAGIHCNCINFVAEAQFLNDFAIINIATPQSFLPVHIFYKELFISRDNFFAELRGPPLSA